MTGAVEVAAALSVADVPAATWDGLVAAGVPFLKHAFLSALEDAGCLGDATGWIPYHLVARRGGEVVGLAPAFLKTHSMGEFVYDWAWADAAARAGIAYYPKLVLAAPLSPVSGKRLFGTPPIQRALLTAALEHARAMDASGVHALFCTPAEVAIARELGFCHRLGHQFHWEDTGYADFEAFLSRFDSKRRNQIRRERRRVQDQGVELRSYVGDEVEDRFIGPAFDFYGATVDRYVWGRRYLNRRFFELLWERQRDALQLVLAWRGEEIVGGSLNLQAVVDPSEDGTGRELRRFGRYWGALAEVHSLHFEVCSYFAIEDCIRRGVRVFEAGAGGEQHKLVRGFLPVATHSVHLLFEPRLHAAIADFCRREAAHVAREAEALREGVFTR